MYLYVAKCTILFFTITYASFLCCLYSIYLLYLFIHVDSHWLSGNKLLVLFHIFISMIIITILKYQTD